MKLKYAAAIVLAGAALAPMASARREQEKIFDGALGAGAGGIVGGPIGALVGGIIGYARGPQISRAMGMNGGWLRRRRIARALRVARRRRFGGRRSTSQSR